MPILTSGGSSLGSACDGSLVSSDHRARGLIPAEPARPFESSCRCRRRGSGIVKEPLDGIGEPIGILRIDERSSFAKDFRQRTAIRRHNRHAHGHRFEDWETESLFKRRLNEHRRTLVQLTALERIDTRRGVARSVVSWPFADAEATSGAAMKLDADQRLSAR